ncbi:MAG: CAP domain-containing protein [Clostridiales bacterium]|nr:CAP domain-containing protein [Clostridiales bacterium]
MEIAASFLVRKGIYTSGWSGELGLGESLSRAELAAIMTLLDFSGAPGGIEEWRKWGAAHFSDPENRVSKFSDLSPWALPYVEYCYQRNLMKGVLESKFDPQGVVTPHMACAVILRYCEIAETGWDYGMSVAKAHSLGLAPDEGLGGSGTLRGTMAVMLYRAICYMDAASGRQSAGAAAAGAASAPSLGAAPSPGAESAAKNGAAPSPGAESAAPAKSVPGAGDAVPAKSIDEMKAEIVRLTNAERAKAGLPELKILPELMKCAQAKAQDMLDNEYYGHTSPVYGPAADMIFKFVPNATTAAENIAAWAKTPQIAFDLWMGSEKGHRENLLAERLTHIGVGIVEEADGVYWWVQQFVKL